MKSVIDRLRSSFRIPRSKVASDKGPPLEASSDLAQENIVDTGRGFSAKDPKKESLKEWNIFPSADQANIGAFRPIGRFKHNTPVGVTVHYTASANISATIKELASKNLGYHLIIDKDGEMYQCAPLWAQLYHAGRAKWLGLSPNRTHIAVALVSWGWLKNRGGLQLSWSGRIIPEDQRREVRGLWWEKATLDQEQTLFAFLKWAVANGIDTKNICGHDECALPAGRKMDPGGVLELSMAQVREITRSSSKTSGQFPGCTT